MEIDVYVDKGRLMLMEYGPRFLGALLLLIIGWWAIGKITGFMRSRMEKQGIDASLTPFLVSLTGALLKILLLISVIGTLGIEMTSFVAILGAFGLAVGMALSGTLQNFAGGVMLLIFKPFKVGDFIEAQGYSGSVKEIQIFNTILTTPDNKTIIIPNGGLSTGSMVNYSTEPLRRVDFTFGIGYGDDVDKAKSVINYIIANDKRILTDPEPFVAVSELADSSVNFAVRVWAKGADYWGVYFMMQEAIYKEFNAAELNIPFPQMDVHIHKQGLL